MINIDNYIVDFVSNNWISLSLVLGALKIIAKMTKSVVDDQISTLLSGVFSTIRGKGFSPAPENDNPTLMKPPERGELVE
jgi:hypothetical protein